MLSGPFCELSNKSLVAMTSLFTLVIAASLAVIYVKHNNRMLYANLQRLHTEQGNLHEIWSQLLLERGTWTTDQRVENIAREELHLVMPSKIKVITPQVIVEGQG